MSLTKGNTVVKPSEMAPFVSSIFGKACDKDNLQSFPVQIWDGESVSGIFMNGRLCGGGLISVYSLSRVSL